MMTDIQPRAPTAVHASLHANTPAVTSPHRSLALLRTPEEVNTRILVTRTVADPLSRTTRLYGARELINSSGTVVSDAVTVTALSGQPLSLHTTDGDRSLALSDAAGRPLWSRNAQNTVTTVRYEDTGEGGRPASLTETATGVAEGRERERYSYHLLTDDKVRARNLAGTTAKHYNNAGVTCPLSASLSGQPLATARQLLKPEVGEPDWARLSEEDLEPSLTVSGTYDATGIPLTQTNADSVTTVSAYDVRGTVSKTWLRYKDSAGPQEVITLQDIRYRADGVVQSQVAGNGVREEYTYDLQTQYLSRHIVSRPADHPLGALLISDLRYTYDPAGNILSLEEKGADPVWHNNQRATGLREYEYDTLYRLTSATGRERHPVDPENPTAGHTWSPYTERYTYDDGNNLAQTVHTGGSGNHTVTMVVSASSNRAVKKPDDSTTPDPDAGFLTGGLQKALSDGRALSWHVDGQLRQVNPVMRTGENQPDDTERYHYADGGTRTRKIRTAQQSGGTQTSVTTYAGGTETRQRRRQDTLQLDIVITEGGSVRLVRDNLTGEVHLRYSFSDHLGSSGGETDSAGRITSREEYLPYGGSAGSVEEAEEIHDRTRRYSGKERDATGLLYYGWRYYQPEEGRWVNADPGGLIDGVNLFQFCSNNPVVYGDKKGKHKEKAIPKNIHHLWHGSIANLEKHYPNLQAIAEKNKGYMTYLHVLPDENEPDAISQVQTSLGAAVKVVDITTEKWFIKFKKKKEYEQFEQSVHGGRPHLASGADILKTRLMSLGGVFNDVDNKPLQALPDSLKVNEKEMLTAGPVAFERWGGMTGIHSSTFAVSEKSKLLKILNKKSYEKFKREKGTIYQINTKTESADEHFRMISETAGSYHFSLELKELIPGFAEQIDNLRVKGETFNDRNIIFDKYFSPTVTTGVGPMDDDQLVDLLQVLSNDPNHVVI